MPRLVSFSLRQLLSHLTLIFYSAYIMLLNHQHVLSRQLWVDHLLFLHAPHVIIFSLLLSSLALPYLFSHLHLLHHCFPQLLHHLLHPPTTLFLISYLSHPKSLNLGNLTQGIKSLPILYILMLLLLLQIAYLPGRHPMWLIIDSTSLTLFPQIWSTVPCCPSMVHMHLTLRPCMLLVLCTSPNSVIDEVLMRKHECLLPTPSFVPLLESTKVGKPGTLSAPGFPASMHGMSLIMRLGLETMNGFN